MDVHGARGHLVLPPIVGPRTRLVVAMHGVLRNGMEYAEHWAPAAARGDRVVLVPELDRGRWPGAPAPSGCVRSYRNPVTRPSGEPSTSTGLA